MKPSTRFERNQVAKHIKKNGGFVGAGMGARHRWDLSKARTKALKEESELPELPEQAESEGVALPKPENVAIHIHLPSVEADQFKQFARF